MVYLLELIQRRVPYANNIWNRREFLQSYSADGLCNIGSEPINKLYDVFNYSLYILLQYI